MRTKTHPKNGDKISVLGYGCMRLPREYAQAEAQLLRAIELGVNYFDTAYIYPGNEALLGRVLAENQCRGRVRIATKLPHYFIGSLKDAQDMFRKQLERLQTDYIDYYLLHMLTSRREWERLAALGVVDWLEGLRKNDQLGNIGFSYHGGVGEFKRLVDCYNWDMCMIQYNYYDEHSQAGREGLVYAHARGIPVFVMEPLRGGRLVRAMPSQAQKLWAAAPGPPQTLGERALRWLWNQPEVFCVLSGMNELDVVEENCALAGNVQENALTPAELELYHAVQQVLTAHMDVPCTGCNYCMPCPKGVDIPMCFDCLNDRALIGNMRARFNYIVRTNRHNAGLCVGCGLCRQRCPQGIAIPQELGKVRARLEGAAYRPMRAIIKKLMRLK